MVFHSDFQSGAEVVPDATGGYIILFRHDHVGRRDKYSVELGSRLTRAYFVFEIEGHQYHFATVAVGDFEVEDWNDLLFRCYFVRSDNSQGSIRMSLGFRGHAVSEVNSLTIWRAIISRVT
jgi:hypothetical protein